MLLAISAAVGFVYILFSWMAQTTSEVFWSFMSAANIFASVLWIAAVYFLLREVVQGGRTGAEPSAPPNSRPPSQYSQPPEAQTPDPLRTPSSGGCG